MKLGLIYLGLSLFSFSSLSVYAQNPKINNYVCISNSEDGFSAVNKISIEGEGETAKISFNLHVIPSDEQDVRMSGVLTFSQDLPADNEELNFGKNIGIFTGKTNSVDGEIFSVGFFMSKGLLIGEKKGKFILLENKFYTLSCTKNEA